MNIFKSFDIYSDFLNEKEKYKEDFESSIHSELYDYSILLVWKTFILFVYEKFFQVAHIIDEDVFLQKWNGKFNQDPRNYQKKNIFWPNEEESSDSKVITFLGVLYNIDSNFLNQLKSNKKKRDTASHVSDWEFDEKQVGSYLYEMSGIIEKLQECHEDQYLSKIDLFREEITVSELKLSNKDYNYFIYLLSEHLQEVGSFDQAEDIMRRIIKIKSKCKEEHIRDIVNSIKQNSTSIRMHQILHSSYGPEFVKELYNLSKLEREDWLGFYKFLLNDWGRSTIEGDYTWLLDKLKITLIEVAEEKNKKDEGIEIEDIPF